MAFFDIPTTLALERRSVLDLLYLASGMALLRDENIKRLVTTHLAERRSVTLTTIVNVLDGLPPQTPRLIDDACRKVVFLLLAGLYSKMA